MVPTAAPHPPV